MTRGRPSDAELRHARAWARRDRRRTAASLAAVVAVLLGGYLWLLRPGPPGEVMYGEPSHPLAYPAPPAGPAWLQRPLRLRHAGHEFLLVDEVRALRSDARTVRVTVTPDDAATVAAVTGPLDAVAEAASVGRPGTWAGVGRVTVAGPGRLVLTPPPGLPPVLVAGSLLAHPLPPPRYGPGPLTDVEVVPVRAHPGPCPPRDPELTYRGRCLRRSSAAYPVPLAEADVRLIGPSPGWRVRVRPRAADRAAIAAVLAGRGGELAVVGPGRSARRVVGLVRVGAEVPGELDLPAADRAEGEALAARLRS